MIAQLRGTLVTTGAMDVVIDCAGVGYAVSVPTSTLDSIPAVGNEVTLVTVMTVREDAMQLFGFATSSERDAFLLLTSVNGVGSRTALGILSSISLVELRDRILRNDLVALQRLPGIGKKTAERLVVELRDKIAGLQVLDAPGLAPVPQGTAVDEALAALVSLGYGKSVAEKAIRAVIAAEPEASQSAERLLRKALRVAGS
jgi:Holliday junction DNA helicase RuvA